jgi:signal peptidase II
VSSAPKSNRAAKDTAGNDRRGKAGNALSAPYHSPAADATAAAGASPTLLGPVPTSRIVVFLSIAILGLAADLITKQVLFAWLGLPQHDKYYWIVKDYVGFQTAVNRGALFGMGEGYWWVFSLLSVVAATAILVWLFYYRAAHDWLLTIALGCVMAGIFGNLYDRLGLWDASGLAPEYEHGVRDWILFRYQQYTWPNFNIADCLLVCGAGLLMWHAWRGPAPEADADSEPTAAAKN